jgi:alpha-L-arabinofuranosidase
MIARRDFLKQAAIGVAAQSSLHAAEENSIVVDPQPLFDISPHLYMQFMEPLGSTDGSVEASWDWDAGDWRKDFIEVVRDLSPDVVRFGGLFSRYYHWREGVGPFSKRPSMRNYVWGARETNRVGTHEFVDFCRRVGAEPLYCVNFLSDGETRYRTMPEGNRTGRLGFLCQRPRPPGTQSQWRVRSAEHQAVADWQRDIVRKRYIFKRRFDYSHH